MSNRKTTLPFVVAVAVTVPGLRICAGQPPAEARDIQRELLVPFEDIGAILESGARHVLLTRGDYETLLQRAHAELAAHAPRPVVVSSADYQITIADGRAVIAGRIMVDVVEGGLHRVALDVSDVGLRMATLDGQPAPLGRPEQGDLELFVKGEGLHEFALDMVVPVESTAALQSMTFRVPTPAATRMRLIVPGDVEVRRGAAVVSRVFDEQTQATRFELLPTPPESVWVTDEAAQLTQMERIGEPGRVSLVMTLNNRLLQTRRVVIARSVLVDEVAESYERLHATFSMAILHRPVDRFRFALPDGFEVTRVRAALLSSWAVANEHGRRLLHVRLNEPTTETVVLRIAAMASVDAARLESWTMPRLVPLDVAGHVGIVGLLVADALKLESLESEHLLAIDTRVLSNALPVDTDPEDAAETGIARCVSRPRAVAAFYAPTDLGDAEETPLGPRSTPSFSARFNKPSGRVLATTNLLLIVGEKDLQVRGGFTLRPEVDELFNTDIVVPRSWHVLSVTDADGDPLAFDPAGGTGGGHQASRIRVNLSSGIAPGHDETVYLHAVHTPTDWLSDWTTTRVEFPAFAPVRSTAKGQALARDSGAISLQGGPDLLILPDRIEHLTPLDEGEKRDYGLAGLSTAHAALAYRFESRPYHASFRVQRVTPRLTARIYSFLRLDPELISAHYEIAYHVEEARTRRLSFTLPDSTPENITIRLVDDVGQPTAVGLSEYESELIDGTRRWTATLTDGRRDTIRLAVDFEQGFDLLDETRMDLPIVRADGVAYQAGLVAVEGNAELDVEITTSLRNVDVGELAGAHTRQEGAAAGGLGVFAYTGDGAEVQVVLSRVPGFTLPPAIVQRAEMMSVVSADGTSQTAARLQLTTNAAFLEVVLPEGSTLWSAELDGVPAKPAIANAGSERRTAEPAGAQRGRKDQDRRRALISLPAASGSEGQAVDTLRDLQIVYETPVRSVAFWGDIDIPAPELLLRTADPNTPPTAVPIADLHWTLCLPSGFRLVRHDGTVSTNDVVSPVPAAWAEARVLYQLAGGVNPEHGLVGLVLPTLSAARMQSRPAALRSAARPPNVQLRESEIGGRPSRSADDASRLPTTRRSRTRRKAPAPPRYGEEVQRTDGDLPQVEYPYNAATGQSPQSLDASDAGAKVVGGGARGSSRWALEGVRSLRIRLALSGDTVVFRSLGLGPRLNLTLAHVRRVTALSWGIGLALGVIGLALTPRPARTKAKYILTIALLSTLAPLVTGRFELAYLTNPSFYVASLLVPFYLAAWCIKWLAGRPRRPIQAPAAATAASLLMLLIPDAVLAETPGIDREHEGPVEVRLIEDPTPLPLPEDAVIFPYQPAADSLKPAAEDSDQLLIPYDRYVDLWNLAYPQAPFETGEETAEYAWAGSAFTTALQAEPTDQNLTVDGHLEFDVFTEQPVTLPLALSGCVVARAMLDGKPARLGLSASDPSRHAGTNDESSTPMLLHVTGEGRHCLDMTLRLNITRSGGWHVAVGNPPFTPAASLALKITDANTELRFGKIHDRRSYVTDRDDETVETVLGPRGTVDLRWRPRVREGRTDLSLTANSEVLFDVREDGLRLVWALHLDLGRSERQSFTILVPADYLLERLEGGNVRGWTVRDAADNGNTTGGAEPGDVPAEPGHIAVDVSLLQPVKGSERITLVLHRRGTVGVDTRSELVIPLVHISGAALHNGRLTVRRSPNLHLRTTVTDGVTRTDIPDEAEELAKLAGAGRANPLGIHAYQAFRFAAVPFTVTLRESFYGVRPTADVQTLLRIAERQRTLECRVNITNALPRPIYKASVIVPDDLDVQKVFAPGAFEWSATTQGSGKRLTVYLATGQRDRFSILFRGVLGAQGVVDTVALPSIEALDVATRTGNIVIQADPAFDIRPVGLTGCHEATLSSVTHWLTDVQREQARLALRHASGTYGGTLAVVGRKPRIATSTITNVRVAETTIEETVLLDFEVTNAGIRSINFTLPGWMLDARITAPMLRQKTVEPMRDESPDADDRVRVKLQLQDDIMGRLRVLVEDDRALTPGEHRAPVPIVETGRVTAQYVVIESAGRDEVVVEELAGLEPLTRHAKESRRLAELLGGGITQAYVVTSANPTAIFRTRHRVTVETAGARIGLARADLIVDAHGAYRATQSYRVDNTTESFLEVTLPEGAELWSANVAGKPVKPARATGTAADRNVRIPLVKNAAGDLDYEVRLNYAGSIADGSALASLRALNFPLIRTVNIPVELSQARLYLPDDYHWFDVGGTMRRVTDEADLAAGLVRYRTRLAERLSGTMERGSPFARARAATSFQRLRSQMDGFKHALSNVSRSPNLHKELVSNQQIIRRAEQQRQQAAVPTEPTSADEDSRAKLNLLFDTQRANRARNLVQSLPGNFVELAEGEVEAPVAGSESFDREWLVGNLLFTGKGPLQTEEGEQGPPQPREPRRHAKARTSKVPGLAQQEIKRELDQVAQRQRRARSNRRGKDDGTMARYQQQLQYRADQAQQFGNEQLAGDVSELDPFMGGLGADATAYLSPSGRPTLTRLAVESPVRGVAYLFTTPRGDVVVTARAVPNRLIDAMWRLGIVLLVFAVYVGSHRLIAHWVALRSTEFHGPQGRRKAVRVATLFILLGALSVIAGVFPGVGLVAIIAGIVVWITLRRSSEPA
ncbi:MAG: hypothetical protein PVI86_07220 [Phycisphaerae bacterium]|jgi:hypothetical protein